MPANQTLPSPPLVPAAEQPSAEVLVARAAAAGALAPPGFGVEGIRPGLVLAWLALAAVPVAPHRCLAAELPPLSQPAAAMAEAAASAPAIDPAASAEASPARTTPTEPAPAGVAPAAAIEEPPSELRSEEANLAKQLANPVASLISVPFQFNLDGRIGSAEDIQRTTLNIQPVVPFRLSRDWNLISRTILPVVTLQGVAGPEAGEPNFGDTLQSLFLSPARPGRAGVIWGVGPVALLPTATGQLSGLHQWGLGPTGVALVQRGHWTLGALANHLWSVANNGNNAALNATFVQPFLSYTTTNAWTFTLNSESSYDWAADQWAVPINLLVGKVTKVGNQLLSVGAGVRYWVDGPQNGPHGWGGRLVVTLLFPTR